MSAAIAFLDRLHPDAPRTLTSYHPRPIGVTIDADERDRAVAWIEQQNTKSNVYVLLGVANGRPSGQPRKEQMRGTNWLWADIDPRASEELSEERGRILTLLTTRLPDHVPPPTIIVDSGRGYWGFWELDSHVADPALIEACNLGLANAFGAVGDKCWNINRVGRLPGTVNHKTGETAHVVSDDPSRVYAITDFRASAEQAPPGGGSRQADADGAASSDPVRVSDLAELDKWGVPDRVRIVIAQGLDPDEPQRHPSRSEWLFDAVCNLLRWRVPPEVVLGIITDPAWAISASVVEKGASARKYAARQIENARAVVASEPPILHKDEPMRSAREFRARQQPTLMHHNSDFLAYDGAAYRDLEDATVRAELYQFLDRALTTAKTKQGTLHVPFHPTKVKVANVLDALMGVTHAPRDIYAPPCWLNGDGSSPSELLACRNGLLHLPTAELLPATPRFFTRNALDFDYDPSAPQPERWHSFLRELWGAGDEISVLQEIIGYLLVPDTSQQKIFLLVGPRRSGKGTIGRVLRGLVGAHNTAGPTLGSLASNFGPEALIGKQLAVVSDMRIGKKTDRAAITENLLRISGEDVITADRKYKSAWTGQLAVRFFIMTNELPNLPDDSGALASRLVPVIMHKSFLGREDPALLSGLLAELPGILRWAIEGWRRLRERGHFVLPEASRETIEEVHTLGSPVAAFLREHCVFDVAAVTPKDAIWGAWRSWCESRGMYVGAQQQFGAKLIAAGQGRIIATKPRGGGNRVPSYAGLRLATREELPEQEEIPF